MPNKIAGQKSPDKLILSARKALSFAEGKTKARLPLSLDEQEYLRAAFIKPVVFFFRKDHKGRLLKNPSTSRTEWSSFIAVEKKLRMGSRIEGEKFYVYYPAKEDFGALIDATKKTTGWSPGYRFPGSFGSVKVDESKTLIRIINIQAHFLPQKEPRRAGSELSKEVSRKYPKWKKRVFEVILLEALNKNKAVVVQHKVLSRKRGFSEFDEKATLETETLIKAAQNSGFFTEKNETEITARPPKK